MGYTQSAVRGFSWQTIQKVGTTGLTLLKIVILARILSPKDFGLFSLASIALGLTESFTQTGVNLTIIQAKESIHYFLDTAWVIAIIRGFLIGAILCVLSFVLSNFFGEPQLLGLIAVCALVPVIKGFINPAVVLFQKDLRFGWDTLFRLIIMLVEVGSAIVVGWLTHSVWALVVSILISAIVEVGLSFLWFAEKPVFKYSSSRASTIFSQARWLNLATFFTYLNENADNFMVGSFFGSTKLGIYQNAYALSHKPNLEVGKALHYGNMPIFARFADDRSRLWRAFKKTTLVNFILSTCLSLPLIFFPQLVVKLVLGDQWTLAASLLPILTMAGILQSLGMTSFTLLLARKEYALLNLHLGLTLVSLVAVMLLVAQTNNFTLTAHAILIARFVTLPIIAMGIYKSVTFTLARKRREVH